MFQFSKMWTLLIGILCVGVSYGFQLQTWNMQDNCGSSIGRGHFAGELRFAADTFEQVEVCNVAVIPTITGDYKTSRVLFYFTAFDVFPFCEDFNVSITNGPSNEVVFTKSQTVAGLANFMCGSNRTVLQPDMFFYVSENYRNFTVTVRANRYAWKSRGKFTLKFASFNTAPCKGDNTLYTCSNDRCISKDLGCEGSEIRACGAEDTSCDSINVEGFVNSIVDELKNVAGWIVVVLVLAVVYTVIKRCRMRHGGYSNIPIIGSLVNRMHSVICSGNSSNHNNRRSSTHEMDDIDLDVPSNSNRNDNVNDVNRTTFDSVSVASSTGRDSLTPLPTDDAPSYEDLFPKDSEPSAPPPPPPPTSQMTSESLPPPPSYDDVMTNHDKYKHDQ